MSSTPKPITAALVKELREKSGAPMMECKNALSSPDVAGDLSKAMDWLRAKGKARAANNADRIASEGLIAIFSNASNKLCSVVEVNSETDFVSRNKAFQEFVAAITSTINTSFPAGNVEISELMIKPFNSSSNATVQDALGDVINIIRENIVIRRAANISPSAESTLATYVHGKVGTDVLPAHIEVGKSAAVVELCTTSSTPLTAEAAETVNKAGRKLAMHVIAATPQFLSKEQVPAATVASETAISTEQTQAESVGKPKPENVIQKVIAGKVNKRLGEICLLTQAHMAEEGSPVVEKYLATLSTKIGGNVTVTSFARWSLGQQQ